MHSLLARPDLFILRAGIIVLESRARLENEDTVRILMRQSYLDHLLFLRWTKTILLDVG